MKKTIVVVIWFLLPALVVSQDERILNTDSLLLDLEILTTTIKENHPMLYMYTTPARFDNLAMRTGMQIKTGVSAPVFYSSMSRLISAVGCGHTYAYPTPDLAALMERINDIPFDIRFVDSSVYISAAYLPEYQPYVGKEIIRINDVPVGRLVSTSLQHISADGTRETAKIYTLEHKFNFYLNLMLGGPGTLYFETTGGNMEVGFPTGFVKGEEETKAEFYVLPGALHSVVLKVPDFDEGKKVIEQCFDYLQKQNTQNLVIDLRDNKGGNGNIGEHLLSYIIDSTLTYYLDKKTTPIRYKEYLTQNEGLIVSNMFVMTDSLTKSYYFNVKPGKKMHFNGKVYVLTNGGTFSTGAYVASVLKHAAGATIVGQETGGSEYAIGAGVITKLVLPYSKLTVRFPLYKWRFNVVGENSGRGVMPDVVVRPDPLSFLQKNDLEMERVVELIKGSKS